MNTSFASVLGGLGDAGGAAATPNRSFSIMRSAVRAAIPKNFVKDRARAIEGIPALASDVLAEGGGGSDGKDGKEKAVVAGEATVSSGLIDLIEHVFCCCVFCFLSCFSCEFLCFVFFCDVFFWGGAGLRAFRVKSVFWLVYCALL